MERSNLCFNCEIGTDGEESEVGGEGGGGRGEVEREREIPGL